MHDMESYSFATMYILRYILVTVMKPIGQASRKERIGSNVAG